MKWMKFKIKTVVEAEDIIISELYDRGLEGAQIEDKVPLSPLEKEQMFVDILPESEADDGTAYLSFFVEENADGSLHLSGEAENADDAFDFGGESGNGGAPGTGPENGTAADKETVLARIEEALAEVRQFMEIGEGTVTVSETEDIDWINNWKQYFKPFVVDEILIKPTWEPVPEGHEDKLLIQIDPGTAFGTGQHETTQLCIRQLRKYAADGAKVLDVGTGSGILGIAALKLGAGQVFGTDLDENAIAAVKENLEANGIGAEKFRVVQGNIIEDKEVQDMAGYGCYDVAVANILAPVIIFLQEEIPVHLKKGGIFITSGIINTKEEDVKRALASNRELEIIETTYQGEWVSITARKL